MTAMPDQRRPITLFAGYVTAAVLVALGPCSHATADSATSAASAYLAESLSDPARSAPTLMALKATGDAELAGVFIALSRSGDKERRLLGTVALRDFTGAQVTKALLERLQTDPAMAIRAEALMALVAARAITDQQLVDSLKIPDEAVQCVAARQLVRAGRTQAAMEMLSRLVRSNDPGTAAISRLTLLAAGDRTQMRMLEEVMTDAETTDSVMAILLEQIAEDKISSAFGLARRAAASSRSMGIRVLAYRALAATSSMAPAILQDEIRRTDNFGLSVRLLSILAEHEGAEPHLRGLIQGGGATAALARFELARRTGNLAAGAAKDAVAVGHPIVIEYFLDRASADVAARGNQASSYVPALLQCIHSAASDSPTMTAEHVRAARAATLLADIGSAEALAGLKAILAEKFSPKVRAAAAGLLKTSNRAACELAAPLLKSPYEELVTDATLALGRFGDPAATSYLSVIVHQPNRHSPALVALASWYLLKVTGSSRQAADELAKSVK
jgi:hypothetical protein